MKCAAHDFTCAYNPASVNSVMAEQLQYQIGNQILHCVKESSFLPHLKHPGAIITTKTSCKCDGTQHAFFRGCKGGGGSIEPPLKKALPP